MSEILQKREKKKPPRFIMKLRIIIATIIKKKKTPQDEYEVWKELVKLSVDHRKSEKKEKEI